MFMFFTVTLGLLFFSWEQNCPTFCGRKCFPSADERSLSSDCVIKDLITQDTHSSIFTLSLASA